MTSSVTANRQDDQQFASNTSETAESPTTSNSSTSTSSQASTSQESTNSQAPTNNSGPCLKLKGSLVPMTTLELDYFDERQFETDLKAKTAQAPGFFDNLPVVIGLEKIDPELDLPFGRMIAICADFSIKIVAVRGGSETQQEMAKQAGIGILAKQKERKSQALEDPSQDQKVPNQEVPNQEVPNQEVPNQKEPNQQVPDAQQTQAPQVETRIEKVEVIKEVEVVKTVVEKDRQISKIVHHPIRSGQQVYASDGDLIVLASVSAGAEILADGNIHVYGALRGRALAGVKGDTSARIFCQSLEAELVSVAGQYKISEDMDKGAVKKPAQVYLDDDTLCFKELEI